MGWTQYPDTKFTLAQEKVEIARICEPWTPLQMSKVGSTWYVAAQHQDIITAFVILTHTKGGWSYKDMDENCGPCETRAPKSLIRKLTPTASSYALKWRQECLDYAARPKFKLGDRIQLTAPAHFGEHRISEFTVSEYGTPGKKRRCFHNPQIGLCRLGSYALQGATKI